MAENASRLGGGTPTSTVNGAQEIYSDEVNITMIFICSLVLLVGVAGNAMVGWCLGMTFFAISKFFFRNYTISVSRISAIVCYYLLENVNGQNLRKIDVETVICHNAKSALQVNLKAGIACMCDYGATVLI